MPLRAVGRAAGRGRGEMSEWFKEHAWKVCRLKRPPGFESLSLRHWFGGVAQLGERLVRNEEVSGSSPLISTVLNLCSGRARWGVSGAL